MSTDCIITFDHHNCVYQSGDNLNGHVKLQIKKSKSIRAITIRIVGYGKVFWNETRGRSPAYFKSHEQYLNSITYVMGSAEDYSFDLKPGIYEYTFTCHLPKKLPTSMQEANCKIKYKVIVTIDRLLIFQNVFKRDFFVKQKSDLNLNSKNKLPRRSTGLMEIGPLFGCFCFAGTDIKAELLIPYGGFMSGQKLPFQLTVYNDSNIQLSGAEVELIKCCTCKSAEPYVKQKNTNYTIDRRYFDYIPRQTNKEFKHIFNLPLLPPTNRTKYIRIDYKLKAKINVFWYSMRTFFVEVPVEIM